MKLLIIVFPSSPCCCTICLKSWWLILMTWDNLLVLTVKGCGILKITPISPAMSADPSFNKNWKKKIMWVLPNNIKFVLDHFQNDFWVAILNLFWPFFFLWGGWGWDILEVSVVFVLLFYGNFGILFSVWYIFLMLNRMPMGCVDSWDEHFFFPHLWVHFLIVDMVYSTLLNLFSIDNCRVLLKEYIPFCQWVYCGLIRHSCRFTRSYQQSVRCYLLLGLVSPFASTAEQFSWSFP